MRIPSFQRISRLEIVAFVVGMAGLTFELAAARIVAPYLGSTIYTWTSIIGVILAALALGYSYGGKLADTRKQRFDIVLLISVAAVLILVVNLLKDPTLAWIAAQNLPPQLSSLMASLYLFAMPTFLLGMASPYITRLTIDTVATSGRHLSRIDAASTFGSLAGTFLTGYFLFELVGTRHLLACVAAVLVAVTFLVDHNRYRWHRLGMLAVIIAIGFVTPRPALSGFLADIDSAYSRIIVRDIQYDGRPARIYQTENTGLQSGVFTDGTKDQVFDYIRAFSLASDLRPAADRYLVIGGGAFTFPEYLARKEPRAAVDTVEIDPKLQDVSRRYFNFDQPGNLRVVYADGRQYLNAVKHDYGMVYLDAFTSSVPPFQLVTAEAAQRMYDALDNDGVLVVNLISARAGDGARLGQHVLTSVRTAFPYAELHPLRNDVGAGIPQNVLLVASKRPLDASRVAPSFAAVLERTLPVPRDRPLVLSDDYAPVEQLAH